MVFLMRRNVDTTSLSLNLHHKLDPFFISHEVVKNAELVLYTTNDEKWFEEFQNHWKNDPIVSRTPPIQDKLSLMEWAFPINQPEHQRFYDHRYTITGADFGFTAFRSYLLNHQLFSEFYSIGSKEVSSDSQSMILDPIFVKQSFRSIIPQFKELI